MPNELGQCAPVRLMANNDREHLNGVRTLQRIAGPFRVPVQPLETNGKTLVHVFGPSACAVDGLHPTSRMGQREASDPDSGADYSPTGLPTGAIYTRLRRAIARRRAPDASARNPPRWNARFARMTSDGILCPSSASIPERTSARSGAGSRRSSTGTSGATLHDQRCCAAYRSTCACASSRCRLTENCEMSRVQSSTLPNRATAPRECDSISFAK